MKIKVIISFFVLFCYSFCYSQSIELKTPRGKPVQGVYQINEMTQYEIDSITTYWVDKYKNKADFLAKASATYNCHSYTWNMTEGGPVCWVDGCYPYISDSSYIRVPEAMAEKIAYSDHSAVKSKTHPGKYESKWGPGPLMRHSPEDCPYSMSIMLYFIPCNLDSLKNQTVTSNATIASCDIEVQNVTVTNNAKLILNASHELLIKDSFEVQLGSTLEVF